MKRLEEKILGRIYIATYFPFHYSHDTVAGDFRLHMHFNSASREIDAKRCQVQGASLRITPRDPSVAKEQLQLTSPLTPIYLTLGPSPDSKRIAVLHCVRTGSRGFEFTIEQQAVFHKTPITIDVLMNSSKRAGTTNVACIDIQPAKVSGGLARGNGTATITIVSQDKERLIVAKNPAIGFLKKSSPFTRNPFKLVGVDDDNHYVLLKPPVPNPLFIVGFPIVSDKHIAVTKTMLAAWQRKCDADKSGFTTMWAGSLDPRQRSAGFIRVVEGKKAPVGAQLVKRVSKSQHQHPKRVKLDINSPSVEGFTAESLLRGPMASVQTVSFDNQSHLANIVAYPQFLRVSDLPPYIGVFREESKFYNASKLDHAKQCGTFYFRMPKTEMFLPIEKPKTCVYNDKAVAVVDMLFKLEEEPRNAGVRRFWEFLTVFPDTADVVVSEVKKPMGAAIPVSIQKRLLHVINHGRVAKHPVEGYGRCATWWDCVVFVYTKLTRRNQLMTPLARLFYCQPPNHSMFVFYTEGAWYTQRTTKLHPSMTKDWRTPKDMSVGVVTRPGHAFTDADIDLFMWVAATTPFKRPVFIEAEDFDGLVFYDCTTQPTWKFVATHSKTPVKIPKHAGNLHFHYCRHFHPHNIDLPLCYIFESLGVDTVVCTSPFFPEETPFTEIIDVRPRNFYEHLVWTGPQDKWEVFALEDAVSTHLQNFDIGAASALMKKHQITAQHREKIIHNFYCLMLQANPTDARRISKLRFGSKSVLAGCNLENTLEELIDSRAAADHRTARFLLNLKDLDGTYLIGNTSRVRLVRDLLPSSPDNVLQFFRWQKENGWTPANISGYLMSDSLVAALKQGAMDVVTYLVALKLPNGVPMIDDFSDTMKSLIEDKNLSSMKAFLDLTSDGKPLVNLNKTPMYSVLQIGLNIGNLQGVEFLLQHKTPDGAWSFMLPPKRVKQLVKTAASLDFATPTKRKDFIRALQAHSSPNAVEEPYGTPASDEWNGGPTPPPSDASPFVWDGGNGVV